MTVDVSGNPSCLNLTEFGIITVDCRHGCCISIAQRPIRYDVPVRMKYKEDKATQAAALLLNLHGGRMSYMKLIKLLYLSDRKALIEWGRPITYDWYYSMPHGPVLSITFNKITTPREPGEVSYWNTYISEKDGYDVGLVEVAPVDQLSEAEEELLSEIYRVYGVMDRWALRDFTHTLPEWRDPQGSSQPIKIRDILMAEGFSPDESAEIEDELDAESAARRLWS